MSLPRRFALPSLVLALALSTISIPAAGPAAASASHLLITEVLYDPLSSEPEGEWVEVFNPTSAPLPLNGWKLGDNTSQDVLPDVTLAPGEYLIIASNQAAFIADYPGFTGRLVSLEGPIGGGLANGDDRVLVADPTGAVIDAMSYGTDATAFNPPCPDVVEAQSLARTEAGIDTDSAADWSPQPIPSPGAATPAAATPTATSTPSPTATFTSTPPPVDTATPTSTSTMTPAPVVYPRLLITEVMYDSPAPGADGPDEWFEILNPTGAGVSIQGWRVEDNSSSDTLPEFVLPAGEYVIIAATLAGFRSAFPDYVNHLLAIEGATIGGGLSNDGDRLRLLAPDGSVSDAMSYGSDLTIFDPSCMDVKPGESVARVPSDHDTDTAADWIDQASPNPGQPGVAPIHTPTATPTFTPTEVIAPSATPTFQLSATPSATPTVTQTPTPTTIPGQLFLNEVLPNPNTVDWDADGQAFYLDEWVELYNAATSPASLGGWALADATETYTIPHGTVIWPRSHLLLFRRQTGLSLSDWRDEVRLLRPDGVAADRLVYDFSPGVDRSYCRSEDGGGYWTKECEVTPGKPNRLRTAPPPPPPASPTVQVPTSVTAARAAAPDTRVSVTGIVTLPPGIFARSFYLQDDTGGIKVYLRSGDFPALSLGDQLRVIGWTRVAYGQHEISVPDASYLTSLGVKGVAKPLQTSTGAVGAANEGRLVAIAGRALRYSEHSLVFDDRTGPVEVYFPDKLGWRRPYVKIGGTWSVVGVVTAYEINAGNVRYQIVPRFQQEVSNAPLVLPVTGGASVVQVECNK